MSDADTILKPGQVPCRCGCGGGTKRRYCPGHDARHKGRLLQQTHDRRWWVREAAVIELIDGGWGRHIDSIILATTPVRSRYRGRFCETRHVDSLHGVVLDDANVGHSVWYCPARSSHGRWVRGLAGWLCSTCIHTRDHSERVWSAEYDATRTEIMHPGNADKQRAARERRAAREGRAIRPRRRARLRG